MDLDNKDGGEQLGWGGGVQEIVSSGSVPMEVCVTLSHGCLIYGPLF